MGKDPDMKPREADSWELALNKLRSELFWLQADDMSLTADINTAIEEINAVEKVEPLTLRVGTYVFWIQVPSTETTNV